MTGTLLDRVSDAVAAWEARLTERNREKLRTAGDWDSRTRTGRIGRGALMWLLLLIWPTVQAARGQYGPVWLTLSGMALFAALFLVLMLTRHEGRVRLVRYPTLVAFVALGITLATNYGDDGYFMVVLPAMATTMVLPVVWPAFVGLLAFTGLAVGAGALSDIGNLFGFGISAFTSGFVIFILRRLFTTIELLREAREDLARAAVADERLRFARDMHDLLGHSLSLIVVKAEVARRLATRDPAAAASEAADIETVGRQALVEVREAVTGYRQRGLTEELDGARAALTGGGVEPVVRQSSGPLGVEADALLSWAVREGTTNVLRHSRARHCTIAVRRAGDAVVLTIADDGAGPGGPTGSGNGLRGLAERFDAVGGTVTTERTEAGFVLTATVPTTTPRAA
ncbi:MAG: histidine kinase [Actinocatenispora sp.]